MITKPRRGLDRWSTVTARYNQWEGQNVARFTTWSVRRRWATFVLAPMLVFCCGGTVLGIPGAWALRLTLEASKGAPSPDAAADSYLMALGYDNEDGLLAILDNDHQDTLLTQWRAYRKAMDGTKPPPSRLDFGSLTVGPVVHGRTDVTTDVSATWWPANGTGTSYRSDEHTWRFQTRDDNGWQVVSVAAPTWCGGYVRADACA